MIYYYHQANKKLAEEWYLLQEYERYAVCSDTPSKAILDTYLLMATIVRHPFYCILTIWLLILGSSSDNM